MQPKLKENPREWQKFAAVLCALAGVATLVAWRRGWVPGEVWIPVSAAAALTMLAALLRPRWFRPVYRGGMTLSFHVGQAIGKVLLVALFLLFVTPLGLALRLFGKDLLALRRRNVDSYWVEAKPPGRLDQMF